MDWSQPPDVERIPGKVSGAWLVKGTRIPADAVLVNARYGYSAAEIADEIFDGLPVERARRLMAFAEARADLS